MTLIVNFAIENRLPVIVGDLLICQPMAGTIPPLPTFADVNPIFPKTATYYPCGLEQKVTLIGAELAIGWAGNRVEAKDTITLLHAAQQNGDLTSEFLDDCLRNSAENTQYVGMFREGSRIRAFGLRCETQQTRNLGKLRVIGTGADRACSFLAGWEHGVTDQPLNAGAQAASVALSMTGSLLQMELATGQSLQESYGGGYEIAALGTHGMYKLGEVTYAFWNAEVISETTLTLSRGPLHVCSYAYTNDVLSIRSLSVDRDEGVRHWFDHIAPIYRSLDDQERKSLPLPELNNKWLCNYVLVRGLSSLGVAIRVNCRPSDHKKYLAFEECSDGIRIEIAELLVDGISRMALNKYREELGLPRIPVQCSDGQFLRTEVKRE